MSVPPRHMPRKANVWNPTGRYTKRDSVHVRSPVAHTRLLFKFVSDFSDDSGSEFSQSPSQDMIVAAKPSKRLSTKAFGKPKALGRYLKIVTSDSEEDEQETGTHLTDPAFIF